MNVFIFPGQGAQFPGMGLEAYKSSDKIKSLFNEADEILGFKLSKVMFERIAGTEYREQDVVVGA
jgi:[acyl-carrier-protein] S-malonyltransferase